MTNKEISLTLIRDIDVDWSLKDLRSELSNDFSRYEDLKRDPTSDIKETKSCKLKIVKNLQIYQRHLRTLKERDLDKSEDEKVYEGIESTIKRIEKEEAFKHWSAWMSTCPPLRDYWLSTV